LSGTDRAALLEEMGMLFANEYKDEDVAGTWGEMVGVHCGVAWEDAMNSGIVKFSGDSVTLYYIVTDSVGAPYPAGDFMVVPDGKKNGWIVDPIWLLKENSAPGGSGGGGDNDGGGGGNNDGLSSNGGGCDTGTAGFFALIALAMFARRAAAVKISGKK
jgi:hypothetical protein